MQKESCRDGLSSRPLTHIIVPAPFFVCHAAYTKEIFLQYFIFSINLPVFVTLCYKNIQLFCGIMAKKAGDFSTFALFFDTFFASCVKNFTDETGK